MARAAADALERLVPRIRRLARAVAVLALAAMVGGILVWALASRLVTGPARRAELAVWSLLLVAPPLVLILLAYALGRLTRIPHRLAGLPERARAHVVELGRLAGETGRARERGWLRSALSVLRLGRKAGVTRELLQGTAPLAFLFSPWTLIGGPLAVAAALAEIAAGLGALLWLVFL